MMALSYGEDDIVSNQVMFSDPSRDASMFRKVVGEDDDQPVLISMQGSDAQVPDRIYISQCTNSNNSGLSRGVCTSEALLFHQVANEEEEKQHDDLKEEVRKMLVMMAPSKYLQKLDLINTIQRFGIAYHFERESLSYMYTCYEEWIDEVDDDDLHAIAICFQLLRQQGYYVSYAFRKFIGNQGSFKKELVNDVHGMLSLYEATQFRVHDKEILDEALNFTITQLKLILPKLSNSHLAQQVSNALKFSIKDGV
ncbi:hypothetical protein CQW23_05988, partial [Capsicum baccatum]